MTEVTLSPESTEALAKSIISQSHHFERTESEKKLRNIKYLMENYRYLQNHIELELPSIEDDSPLTQKQLSLFSLLGYRERSREMMLFINDVLAEYKRICRAGNREENEKYDVIAGLYIDTHPLTYDMLAQKCNCAEKTVRRIERKALQELSVMLFGIDSINDMSK